MEKNKKSNTASDTDTVTQSSDLSVTNPVAVGWLKGIGVIAATGALGALVILFILAGDPARLGRAIERLARVVPSFAVK